MEREHFSRSARMATTCSFAGCKCDNYREYLVAAAHLVVEGNCINCEHPVNLHPKKPTSDNFITEVEDLRRDILQEVLLALRQRSSFVTNTETRDELTHRLRRNKLLQFNDLFEREMDSLRVEWWPVGGQVDFPDFNSEETVHCQPFVSKILKLFVSGRVRVEGDGSERIIRSVPDPEAYKKKLSGQNLPDGVFYDGTGAQGTPAITMLLEVKGGGNTLFTPSEQGQLIGDLDRLMTAQPYRDFVIGVLTDGRRFWFLRCRRGNYENTFEETYLIEGERGWQVCTSIHVMYQRWYD